VALGRVGWGVSTPNLLRGFATDYTVNIFVCKFFGFLEYRRRAWTVILYKRLKRFIGDFNPCPPRWARQWVKFHLVQTITRDLGEQLR